MCCNDPSCLKRDVKAAGIEVVGSQDVRQKGLP
jgi:hypothetical protein